MGAGALLSRDRPSASGRRRIVACVGLAVAVLAGLSVHVWMPDSAASDIAGDALYAVAAMCAVVTLAPRLPVLAAGAIALGWCIAIELLQLTPVPGAAAALLPASMLVLGTVFDPRDLIVYALAVIAVTALDLIIGRRAGAR